MSTLTMERTLERPSGARTYARAAAGMAGRTLRTTFRNPALLTPPIFAPLIFFAIFGGGLGALGHAPGFHFAGGYTSFSFVFILLNSVTFAALFSGFAVAQDLESGFSRRLMLGAGRRSATIVGYAASAAVRVVIGMAALFAVGTAVGVRVQGSAWNAVALVGIGFAYGMVVALWAIGMALRVRSMQGAPAMQVPALIALFFAPAFAPLALLTGWIHGTATWNPVSYLLESGRGFVAGDPTDVARAFLALAVLLPLVVVWTATGLRRASRTV
ncbi:MAG: ABC transporter permease [Actinomycetota bacterium]